MRITKKDLEDDCKVLNTLTDNPLETYTKTDAGIVINVGNYHIESAYGGYKLVQISQKLGGKRDITTFGFGTKRQVHDAIRAIINVLRNI